MSNLLPPRRTAAALTAATIALALLAGCGSDPSAGAADEPAGSAPPSPAATSTTPSPTPSPTPSSTPAPTPAPEVPPFPEGTKRQAGDGSDGANLVLTDVRAAEKDGFDRVVLEFSGKGTVGWGVNYVDEAVLEGSGDVVDLGGDAVLQIVASNTTWPAPDYYSGPTRVTPRGDGGLDEVYVGGTFEGYTQLFAGVDDGAVPFRVFTLTSPSRLVVDLADADAASPAAGAGDPPPFPQSTKPQTADSSYRAQLVVTDVRVAEHDGFDRIVVTFKGKGKGKGKGRPGWRVEYVKRAVREGIGSVVRLEGDRVLQIFSSGNTAPSPDYYDGPKRLRPSGDGNVEEVYFGGTFEGYTQLFAGIDGDRAPFRVFTLTRPKRLVVDVEHAD